MSLESLRTGTSSSYFRKSIAKTASNGLGSSVQSCAGQCIDLILSARQPAHFAVLRLDGVSSQMANTSVFRDWPLISAR